MATERVPIIRCDVCTRTAHTYAIQMPDGSRYSVDLCDQHSRPLTDLAVRGRRTARMPRSDKIVVQPRPTGTG